MARKFDITQINLDAYELEPFINNDYKGFTIRWDSEIGFGEYVIYKHAGSDEWYADFEHMDSNADKAFIKELMRLFIEKITIED